MHDLVGHAVNDDGHPITPAALVMWLEVWIVGSAESPHCGAVEFLEERRRDVQRTVGQTLVNQI